MLLKSSRQVLILFFILVIHSLRTSATWSIIILDPKTKQIGIAGASCTPSVYGIGAIYPGKGAIVVQADGNPFARLQGFRMLMDGFTPSDILDSLKNPLFDPDHQQYALISLADPQNPVAYTGAETIAHSNHLTGNGISVQGNMLTHPGVVQAVYDAAIKARKDSLPLQEILMIALEAGAKAGGDKRCGERKAASAFLIVANPGDDDKYWLNLAIYGDDGRTHAVEALREKFNDWKSMREK